MSKKTSKRSWIAVTLAIVALFAIVISGILTDWFTEGNKFCLFGHDYGKDNKCVRCGKEKLDDLDIVDSNGGLSGTVVAELYGMRMSAARAAAQSNEADSWVLTASVNASATDKYVTWSVAWTSDSPVTGDPVASNYIAVEPVSAGALQATVTCLKPFSKPINVVVTSRSNPDKSAVCKFDYIKKITGITVNMPNIADTTSTFSYDIQLSEGTVDPTTSVSVGNMYLTNNFSSAVYNKAAALCPDADIASFNIGYANLTVNNGNIVMTGSDTVMPFDQLESGTDFKDDDLYDFNRAGTVEASKPVAGIFLTFLSDDIDYLSGGAASLTNVFREAVLATSGAQAQFDITGSVTYGGSTYTFTTTIDCRFDGSALTVPVSELTLDKTQIYF